tara:strand:- start:198 stop:1031 length:834 start_codon:yes stop_codon:yes gene_type:complete
MSEYVQFDVKQFSSGEYQVKVINRIRDNAIIHWNWFDKNQRDLMLLLTKIGAIKKQYGQIPITIDAPYLPYARQDRVFEAGQDIAIETLTKAICGRHDDIKIEAMAVHCSNIKVTNQKHLLLSSTPYIKYVFPDMSAKNKFRCNRGGTYMEAEFNCINFIKVRDYLGEVTSSIEQGSIKSTCPADVFLICDDICAGGRKFIECAKALRQEYGDGITIELMVYHAFLDHGLEGLKASGISKIYIINPDSYEYVCNLYVCNLYPNDLNYFEYKEMGMSK